MGKYQEDHPSDNTDSEFLEAEFQPQENQHQTHPQENVMPPPQQFQPQSADPLPPPPPYAPQNQPPPQENVMPQGQQFQPQPVNLPPPYAGQIQQRPQPQFNQPFHGQQQPQPQFNQPFNGQQQPQPQFNQPFHGQQQPQPQFNQAYQGNPQQPQFDQAYQKPQQKPVVGYPPAQSSSQPISSPHHQQQYNATRGTHGQFNGNNGIPSPIIQIPRPVNNMGWKTGLFDCMEDPTNALITFFFPCVTFGQIAEIIDNGNTPCSTSGLIYGLILGLTGMSFVLSCTYRTKLREKFRLLESPAPDWITHCMCEPCALCQEYRELNLRDLDPSIGWQANLARNPSLQQRAMAPPMPQTMMG